MNLFRDTYLFEQDKKPGGKQRAMTSPWLGVDIISSNCPRHIGIRLERIADNKYKCPRGGEAYDAQSSVANQTNKDRYDIGIDFLKEAKMQKIILSSRDEAVDPGEFESERTLEEVEYNNVHYQAQEVYYLGYTTADAIAKQLKERGMDIDADAKKVIKHVVETLSQD
jgi:hypothetical protein